jgi:hypothetical protein
MRERVGLPCRPANQGVLDMTSGRTPAFMVMALLCGTAQAQMWADDFNRPDGPLGPDWMTPAPSSAVYQIQNQRVRHTSSGTSFVRHAHAIGDYQESVSFLDVFSFGTGSQNSKIMIGMGGTVEIEVKIQDQDSGTPGFTHYALYRRPGLSWPGTGSANFTTLNAPFQSGRIKVYFSDPDTIVLEVDTDFSGIPDQIYSRTGILGFAHELGTGFGVGAWNAQAEFDNWSVTVGGAACYANCDSSTTEPVLNVEDFTCFISEFAAASVLPPSQQITHYANCDNSTTDPVLNVEDFTCFITKFAEGCP